jgi:class 3 adenylate cyclase
VPAVDYPTGEETSPSLAALVATVDIAEYPWRGQTSPDGSMTVVVTDLEGSTGMLERLGEERCLEVIRDHNRLVRERVSAHDGVVLKSRGDGFMLIFASASAALASALELQEVFSVYSARLAEEPLRVRIGLHTGNVFQERNDFLGKTVVVAARITGRARRRSAGFWRVEGLHRARRGMVFRPAFRSQPPRPDLAPAGTPRLLEGREPVAAVEAPARITRRRMCAVRDLDTLQPAVILRRCGAKGSIRRQDGRRQRELHHFIQK